MSQVESLYVIHVHSVELLLFIFDRCFSEVVNSGFDGEMLGIPFVVGTLFATPFVVVNP